MNDALYVLKILFLRDGQLSPSLSLTLPFMLRFPLVRVTGFIANECHLTRIGRGACAGKQLGLMEMRYVLTEILSNYDISFAPGQDPNAFINGLRDCFTLELPQLNMVFTPRAGK